MCASSTVCQCVLQSQTVMVESYFPRLCRNHFCLLSFHCCDSSISFLAIFGFHYFCKLWKVLKTPSHSATKSTSEYSSEYEQLCNSCLFPNYRVLLFSYKIKERLKVTQQEIFPSCSILHCPSFFEVRAATGAKVLTLQKSVK